MERGGRERGARRVWVPVRWNGDSCTLCCLLDPRTIGGFCIYIPVWVAWGQGLQAHCYGRQDGKVEGVILFVPRV